MAGAKLLELMGLNPDFEKLSASFNQFVDLKILLKRPSLSSIRLAFKSQAPRSLLDSPKRTSRLFTD
jgi:hypothetical protein